MHLLLNDVYYYSKFVHLLNLVYQFKQTQLASMETKNISTFESIELKHSIFTYFDLITFTFDEIIYL